MHFMIRPRSLTHLLKAGLVHCVPYDAIARVLVETVFVFLVADSGAVLISVALLIALSARLLAYLHILRAAVLTV